MLLGVDAVCEDVAREHISYAVIPKALKHSRMRSVSMTEPEKGQTNVGFAA
ncbi:Uncharacterised protein [Dermatophilus congolensis]|uniref:Uncharacterized protein n=1 Tax=Dermatophilus congolensis TaxID=1863 RepID=A0A239V8T5_9MICO|nr:Uncharacterised protein [Dermatophilus congolensis]